MTNVTLHGALAKRFGKTHRFNVGKPVDVIRALMANKKGFRNVLKSWGRKGYLYEIICDGRVVETEEDFVNPREIKQIDIVPVMIGASKVWKIVIGVILIIVGIILNYFSFGTLGNFFIKMGVALIVAGIMEILFPPQVPSFQTSAEGRSFLFGSTQNSATRGNAVQIGYGRMRVGSQIISTVLEPRRIGGGTPIYTGPIGGNEDSFNGLEVYRRMEQDRMNEAVMSWTMQNYWWERQDPISKEGGV